MNKKRKRLSVLVTTYNRPESLSLCLKALSKQDYPKKYFEVIVIDDGSDNETYSVIKYLKSILPIGIKYYYQNHGKIPGISKARNKGLDNVCGEYVLIIGDDILVSKNFIKEHMKLHKKEQDIAVLGFTDWDPKINVSPFMKFLIREGHQFDYKSIKDINNCNYGHFYTSNISLSSKWFKKERFDQKMYVCEDTDMGYRLKKKGLRIVFNKKAIAYHHHYLTEKDFYKRTRDTAYFYVYLYKKYPELKNINILKLKVNIAFPLLFLLSKLSNLFVKGGLNKFRWRVNLLYNSALGSKEAIKKYFNKPITKDN